MPPGASTEPRILFVDEGSRSETIIPELLDDTKFPYQTAADVFDAVKTLQTAEFSCVLVALPRSDVSPRDFVEFIREYSVETPVVFVGKDDEVANVIGLIGTDGVAIVPDPTDQSQLESTITRVVTHRRVETDRDRHTDLKTWILTVVLEIIALSGHAEIERILYEKWFESDLYSIVLLGEYYSATAELILKRPFSGRFSAPDIESLGGEDAHELLERAVTTGNVATGQGPSVNRAAASTAERPPNQRPFIESDIEPGGTARSIAVVPIGYEEAMFNVLILLSDTGIDNAEQELLNRMGRAVGRVLWMNERSEDSIAAEGNRLQGFVNLFSHEIRNPLSIAMTRLDSIRDAVEDEDVDAIASYLDQIDTILGTFGSVVRPEGVTDTQVHDFGDTAADAWGEFEFPDAELFISDSRPLAADHALLERLFSNLFRNAIQYGGDTVTIKVGVLENGLYVEDDGPGVQAGDQDRVFDWGYSTADHGTGLGLSFVKEIVRAHGWEISLFDSDFGGARFEVTGIDWDRRSIGGTGTDSPTRD